MCIVYGTIHGTYIRTAYVTLLRVKEWGVYIPVCIFPLHTVQLDEWMFMNVTVVIF